MAEDVVRIKVGMAVSYIAASKREDIIEVPRAEWDAMNEKERQDYLEGLAQDEIDNSVDAWAVVVGEDGGED